MLYIALPSRGFCYFLEPPQRITVHTLTAVAYTLKLSVVVIIVDSCCAAITYRCNISIGCKGICKQFRISSHLLSFVGLI